MDYMERRLMEDGPKLFYCVSTVWRFLVRRNGIESKLGCVSPMVFVSLLPRAKYERNDQLEDTPHLTSFDF